MENKKKLHPYTAKNVSPIHCICCDAEIKLLDHFDDDPISSNIWRDGIVQEISAGYGSDWDGDVYLIGICDKCLEIKRNNGNAIFLYDYLFKNEKMDQEYRDEYNIKLHRKMKLERILKNDKV